MNADSLSDNMTAYYVFEDTLNQKTFTLKFHPAFTIFHKILILLQEYNKNNIELSEKDIMLIMSSATNQFETLEKEQYINTANDVHSLVIPQQQSKIRRFVIKVLAKLERIKNSKNSTNALRTTNKGGIQEDPSREDDTQVIGKLQLKKTDIEKPLKRIDDYSSREMMGGITNIPRGRDLLFSYNTQYGGGFGHFKNTRLNQYCQAYSRIEDKKVSK